VVEAMALSRPVVATNIGGSQEQVVDGVTGYLVNPNDPAAMADGIEMLLMSSDKRQKFGNSGHARFLEKFEFEGFYRRLLEIYDQAIAENE
jgi:glycosyltransferase involved in cell wall biosynthesis